MINATYESLIGKPIESLQTILRRISFFYEDLPQVLPDGIFGEQTKAAVEAFQIKFELEPTGEVDFATWEVLIDTYYGVLEQTETEGCVYPNEWFTVAPYEESELLLPMQAMLKNISGQFANLTDVELTGVHDEKSIAAVRNLQGIFGMEQNGIIDNVFWNNVERLYRNSVQNDLKNYECQ